MIVKPYTLFYDTYANIPFSKNKGKYVQYSKETLEAIINKSFEVIFFFIKIFINFYKGKSRSTRY